MKEFMNMQFAKSWNGVKMKQIKAMYIKGIDLGVG